MINRQQQFFRQEIKEVTFLIIFGVLMSIVLPLFLGFGLKAFEESFVSGRPLEFGDIVVKFMLYYIMIVGGLLGLGVLKVREMFLVSRGEMPWTQKRPSIFSVAYVHDPEVDGAIYHLFRFSGFSDKKNPMNRSKNILRMFVISTLIFGAFGLVQTLSPNAQMAGIPQLTFQVTKTANVLFTAEPASTGETLLLVFLLSIFMGVNAYLCSKYKLGAGAYWIIAFMLVCPLIGLGWMGFHFIAYGHSDVALMGTFLFGFLGATLTVLSGSYIMWYVWHFWNNVFAKLREVVSANEDIVFIAVISLIILLVLWLSIELLIKKGKYKSVEQNNT